MENNIISQDPVIELDKKQKNEKNSLTAPILALLIVFCGTTFVGFTYLNKKISEDIGFLEKEVSRVKDLTVANQRILEEKRETTSEKLNADQIYKIEDIGPSLNEDLGSISPYISDNLNAVNFEVYGGIYEQLANVVDKTQNSELKSDLKNALSDGAISFDEYRVIRTKYDLTAMLDQQEAQHLQDLINKSSGTENAN